MNKRWYLLLIMLLIGAFVLVACGAPAEPTEVPTEAAPVVDTAATEAAMHAEETKQAEIAVPTVEAPLATLRIWADDTRAPILLSLAEDFKAAYNVELVVEQVADINNQFTLAAPAGEGPDIFIGPHDRIGGFIASGLLAPIDLGEKASLFTDVALQGFTYDGQLYGVPYATENMAFFRNADLAPDAPATWDDVITTGAALQTEGKIEYVMALSGTTYDAFPIMTSFNGYVFGRDDQGNYNPNDVGIDGEGMVAAGQWLSDQITAGYLSDNTDWDTAHTLFETGKTAYLMAGPWALDRLRASGINFAISNFPAATQPGQSFAGIQGFMINALSENTLLAQAFLTEFVATDDVMTQLYKAGNRPSAFASVLAATDDPDLVAFGEAGAEAALMPAIPEMGSVWSAWNNGITLIIQGQQTPIDALTDAAGQIRTLIAGALAGMVNVPGSYQDKAGCGAAWDPACAATALTKGDDGLYTGTFTIPAGSYETKVALDGSWTTNYGMEGVKDGPNYAFEVPADGPVTFSFDPATNILTITVGP